MNGYYCDQEPKCYCKQVQLPVNKEQKLVGARMRSSIAEDFTISVTSPYFFHHWDNRPQIRYLSL